ncbi:MAG TPA: PadR family transcriptional regulator [Caulobacterales bacterium]|nr:PadR family transcriptional regulator [Caulobacterales bacterium]
MRMHGHRFGRHRGFGGGEGGGPPWAHRMWGGGGRRGRMFEQGALRLVILRLLSEKPRHGYEIIKAVEEAFGGGYTPSPGIVYPTLTLLEELGYATVTAQEGGKKLFAITPEGETFLGENAKQADGVFARIHAAREAFGGGPPAPVLRAMENLRMAGRMRLARGDLSEVVISIIVEALDEAARKIEKS